MMNFNLEPETFVEIVVFLALLYFMFKTNKNGFKSIEDSQKSSSENVELKITHLIKSSQSGFEMVDLKINNLVQMIALEREGTRKDICFLEDEVEGVKNQFKDDIYPRLNTVEGAVKKNCQALNDFKDLCKVKCKV